ncbi:MAG: LysR family transcriptional regulator [Myxococcaceae bacterium]|nr:LysR family transcriptional regulator [Myxococcaceae bacterium]
MNNLDAINLELLRTFVVAAAHRTFGEAARARGVSVSAISQQVKQLEAQTRLALFERLGRRVRLTREGAALAEVLRTHLGQVAAALEEASGAVQRLAGLVTVGGPRTFGGHFVLPRLAPLLREHPGLRVDQVFDVPSALEPRLLDGALDFAVLGRPAQLPGLETEALAQETFVCVTAPALLRRLQGGRDEAALLGWPWLIFDRDLPMHASWWKAAFGRPAPPPARVVSATASLEQLQALAEAGLGAVVLPDYLVAPALASGALALVEPRASGARPPRPARNTLFLSWRRGAPASARTDAVRAALLAKTAPRLSARR